MSRVNIHVTEARIAFSGVAAAVEYQALAGEITKKTTRAGKSTELIGTTSIVSKTITLHNEHTSAMIADMRTISVASILEGATTVSIFEAE